MFGFMSGIQSFSGMGMSVGAGFSGMSSFSSMSSLASMFLGSGSSWGSNSWTGMSVGSPMVGMAGGMFGYMGGTDSPASAAFRMPIYRDRYERQAVYKYEDHKAWDYQFQKGQLIHQTEVTASEQVRILAPRDPVILDLNEDGQLGVTGKDDSRKVVNEVAAATTSVRTEGNREITTTTTQREWDLQVNWDKKIDFDVDGDGAVDRTEWLQKGAGDGFLVFDANNDGQINGRELMNETGLNGEQNLYKSGWDKTRALFDKDGDGQLQGQELAGLKIWMDRNGDGKTDPGELQSLDQLGIVKVDTVNGGFTKKKLVGYQTIHHKDEIGYVEHNTYAGFGNSYGVGSRLVIGGQVLQDFQMGA